MALRTSDQWNARYEEGTARWDLGKVRATVRRIAEAEPKSRVFLPGAGYGHDAIGWGLAGHHAVAADFAPLAVEGARTRIEQAGVADRVTAREVDIFALSDDLLGSFDRIWEQTCLCAIDPSQREAYVDAMATVLRPDGQILGVLWNNGFEDGPPYDMRKDDIVPLLERRFVLVEVSDVPDSPEHRTPEWFFRGQLR